MSNLVQRYEQLKKAQDEARTSKIQAETNLANLNTQKEKLEAELLKVTNTTSVAEALVKLEKLQEKLDELTTEAENILNDN